MTLSFPKNGSLANYRELVRLYEARHGAVIASGEVVHYARYPVFALVIYFSVSAIRECRSSAAIGYGIGLLNAWSILWSSALVIFHDARKDFKRVEKIEVVHLDIREEKFALSSSPTSKWRATESNGDKQSLRNRGDKKSSPQNNRDPLNEDVPSTYTWQSLPTTLSHRLDWTADLVSNFRGTGWNFQISSIPTFPLPILHDPRNSSKAGLPAKSLSASSTGNTRYPTPRSLLLNKLSTFLLGYLALDTLKVLLMKDPYFWGIMDSPPPSYLPSIITSSSTNTHTYRLVLSLLGTYTPLQTIFAMGPLFFVGLVGPRYIGVRAEVWQYPDMYGSYKTVFAKGLAGWWGGWWHQTFRFAFEAPSKWLEGKLGWEKRSAKSKVLALLVAFGCSGCLHATASYTMWTPTHPIGGPFRFFALQPVGIGAQMLGAGLLSKIGLRDKLPRWVRGLGNFVFVHVWFYYTAPFLTDDFARGGIWLFEPVPISLWRGLGWGLEGEGWWCWHGQIVSWWWGKRWWQSGLAF
ncbi:hypothetical protein MMC06_005402 [Schaereria dolodes]|nr:hypothetical protein [Schaereria dolodes]